MTDKADKVEKLTIALYPAEKAALLEIAREQRVGKVNYVNAIRALLREHAAQSDKPRPRKP